MPSVIVSDTSCLLLLYEINQLELLHELFGKIVVTTEVAMEYERVLPSWIEVVEINYEDSLLAKYKLGKGEASSIAYTMNLMNSLLIIDELKGRRIASDLGVKITGTLGLIAAARRKRIIELIYPIIDTIKKTDFRITEKLVQKVISSVEEEE